MKEKLTRNYLWLQNEQSCDSLLTDLCCVYGCEWVAKFSFLCIMTSALVCSDKHRNYLVFYFLNALSYFAWGKNQFLWTRRKLPHHPHLHKHFRHPQVFFLFSCLPVITPLNYNISIGKQIKLHIFCSPALSHTFFFFFLNYYSSLTNLAFFFFLLCPALWHAWYCVCTQVRIIYVIFISIFISCWHINLM